MRAGNIAAEIGVGIPTLRDIINELMKPGLTPGMVPKPILQTDVLDIED